MTQQPFIIGAVGVGGIWNKHAKDFAMFQSNTVVAVCNLRRNPYQSCGRTGRAHEASLRANPEAVRSHQEYEMEMLLPATRNIEYSTSSTRCCLHHLATPKIVRCRTGHERIHRARHFHYGSVNGKSNAGLKVTAVSLAWLAKYHAERNLGKLQAERHYEVPSQPAHVK